MTLRSAPLYTETSLSMFEFWWLICIFFIGCLILTILHAILSKTPKKDTTVIKVQTPKFTSESPSITINITHHLSHSSVPYLRLPSSSVSPVTHFPVNREVKTATIASATSSASTSEPKKEV